MEMPPQGRITEKTPDEWFNEIFPLLSMVLLAGELVGLARKHNADTLSVKLDTQEALGEHSARDEQTAQTMELLDRVVGCIKNYGAQVKAVGDIWSMWRESARREVLISQDSEAAAQFDLYIGPIEDFVARLHRRLRTLLAEKLAEEPGTDFERWHVMLLECLS